MGWARFLSFARDMAEGIAVMHNLEPEPIIHRDLKSLNLLVQNHLVYSFVGGLAQR